MVGTQFSVALISQEFSSNMTLQVLANGGVASPRGFQAGGARGGIKQSGEDVGLIIAPENSVAAAVWTQNQVKAAPVLVCAQHATNATTRAIVFNSGNANCCTGAQGLKNAERMCELAAQKIGCVSEEVLICSTGIIGHALPLEKVESALQVLAVGHGDEFSAASARASMTTDVVPKHCAAQTEIDGHIVTVGGQAKGVGMIGPDMAHFVPTSTCSTNLHATMLAFLTTDAKIDKARLQTLLERAVARSFNSVTVDGDTSTNDTAILIAGGQSGVEIDDDNQEQFIQLLQQVCDELARKIARDGEGATKLVTIEVTGANTEGDAKKIAMTIANSPLVKTAIFGRDPNWGRLAMAAGRAGVDFDAAQLSIEIGDVKVFENGEPLNFDVSEAETAMSHEDLTIRVRIGAGASNWTAWTCDFSYDYVKINAEYHT